MLIYDATTKTAVWQGRRVRLTIGEARMVEALTSRPGVPITHKELYCIGKGMGIKHAEFYNATRATMKRLRDKLGDTEHKAIQTFYGAGYFVPKEDQ